MPKRRTRSEDFNAALDRQAIVAAIREAEAKGRGEIRVHVHPGRVPDPRREAERVFVRLGMEKTAHRAGCLLFLAPEERAFVVLGDAGIDAPAGRDLWLATRDAAALHFVAGRFTEGVVAAVRVLGDALARHLPPAGPDPATGELPDEGTAPPL